MSAGRSFLSPGSGSHAQQPLPANPEQPFWLARTVVVIVSLAWLGAQSLRDDLLPWALAAQQATTPAGAPDMAARLGGNVLAQLARPDSPLVWVPFLALVLLLVELVRDLLVAASLQSAVRKGSRTYYRVRTLHPHNRSATPDPMPVSLWTALLASLTSVGRDRVALSISRTANLPAQLGVQVRGLNPLPADMRAADDSQADGAASVPGGPRLLIRRRGRGPVLSPPLPDAGRTESDDASIIRRVIAGVLHRMDPTMQMEPWDDPLSVVEPGMVVVSQDLTLSRAPHWPLTVDEHADGGVLRSLAHALAVPEGVIVQEYQIIPVPTRDRGARRWPAMARRQLARLRRTGSANLTGDVGVASEVAKKLGDVHAVVTIRLVVVAQSNNPAHLTAAHASIAVMRAALAELNRDHTLPHSSVLQELVPIAAPAANSVRYRAPQNPRALRHAHRALAVVFGLAVLGFLAMLGSYAARGVWAGVPYLAPLAHPWLWWAVRAEWAVTVLLAGTISIWQQALVQPWVALRRVARRRDGADPMLTPSPFWRQPAVLGSMEASQLWHLPDAAAATEVSWTPNRIIPAPASAFVPSGKAAGTWVTLGHAFDSGGQLRPVGVPLRALHQMMHITAGMGAGKSQAAAAMCAQLIPHGFIILDGKGDDEGGSLATVVRRLIPPSEEHRLTFLNVLETGYPTALNPIYDFMVAMERASGKAERDLFFNSALGLILGLFERLDPERWNGSPGMQQYALMGSHLVLRTGSSQPGQIPTMAKVARALEDEDYRKALIARYPFKTDLVYRFWTLREEGLSEAQKTSLQALLRRLDLFMANPITRPMLTVEQPSVDLRRAMDEGKIIIIPMPHRSLGGLGPLVGMLVLQSIVAAAYARTGDAQSRITAPVFIDEVQVFVVNDQSPDLEQAFTQLRGFAVPMIVMHQTLKQIGALKDTFTINAANRLILRTGEPDASEYAKMYSQAGIKPEDIKGMEALHHQYAVTLGPNREPLIFSLRPNSWPVPPNVALPPLPDGVQAGSWQTLVPPPDPNWSDYDRETYAIVDDKIAQYNYRNHSPSEFDRIAGQMAKLVEDEWAVLLYQWDRVRRYHAQMLLQAPAQEPDQFIRQTWLSNLVASRGALIEEAITLRQELGLLQDVQAQVSVRRSLPPLTVPPADLRPIPSGEPPAEPLAIAEKYPTADDMAVARRARAKDMPGFASYVPVADNDSLAPPADAPQEAEADQAAPQEAEADQAAPQEAEADPDTD